MKPITFLAIIIASIYAAMRWEWYAYLLLGLFGTAALTLIYVAIYQHLRANRYL